MSACGAGGRVSGCGVGGRVRGIKGDSRSHSDTEVEEGCAAY